MPEVREDFLLVPCGGSTLPGTGMRSAVLRILEQTKAVKILDLAPYLAGLDIQKGLLEGIPPERRIAISGCSECCPHVALTSRGIEVGHRLSVNMKLMGDAAVEDLVRRVFEIAGS